MQPDPTPDQAAFQQAARAFARQHVAPLASRIDERDEFPVGLVRLAGEHGFMGMTIPAERGWAGRDYVSAALAYEEIAAASATLAVILVVNNALVVEPLFRFGSEEQKARWLRPLARGEIVGAFALSEEDAGTDAANQQTVAEPLPGGGMRLNGRKTWVTCASVADVMIVFGGDTKAAGQRPVSAFMVPMNTPGLVRGARAESMGVRGLGGMDVELRDVDVAGEALLGMRGAGFEIARWAFEGARIAIAAQAIGIGQVAFEEALAKLYASEAAVRVTDRAMQILASAGYRRGSTLERLYRDVRAAEMYPGTSEVQRMLISGAVLRG